MTRGRRLVGPRVSLFYFLDIITAMSGILILIALFFATCLQEGSPLFPGSRNWRSPDLEQELQAAMLRLAGEKNRNAEIREKLPWADLSPADIRRKLRRLQAALSGENPEAAAEPRPLEQVLQEVGLASLQEKVRDAEEAVRKRREAVGQLRGAHEEIDGKVRRGQEALAAQMAGQKGLRLVADGRDTTKAPVVVEVSDARVTLFPFDQPEGREVMEPGSQAIRQLRRRFSVYSPETHYAFLLVQPSGYGLFATLREQLIQMGFEIGYEGVPEDPRFLMPDISLPRKPAAGEGAGIGEPEPWPVEGRSTP